MKALASRVREPANWRGAPGTGAHALLLCERISSKRGKAFGLIPGALGPLAAGESVDVATENPMTAGVAGRYASALFELAHEQNRLDEVDADLGKFQSMLDASGDLKRLVNSPAFAAEDQQRALKAVMDWASIGATTGSFLGVVARNRRLFAAEDMLRSSRRCAPA